MLFEHLPAELLLEIFSYIHPSDLYFIFIQLSNERISSLIKQLNVSLNLIRTSFFRYSLILKHCLPFQIVYLRLTNQYSHGLLIAELFSLNSFHPKKLVRLRSLYLDDIVGNEIDCLPPYLETLHIQFHKKAKYAIKFYQMALRSTSLKRCYLIGGYAFDCNTCSQVSSSSITHLHMAIKTYPTDLFVVLQAFPCLRKLKTRVYNYSSNKHFSSSTMNSSLMNLNIDLQRTGITLTLLNNQLLCYLPQLNSLTFYTTGKLIDDNSILIKLSNKLKRIRFIQRGLSTHTNMANFCFIKNLVTFVQDMTNKNSNRILILHTTPYPDKVLTLPFIQWYTINTDNDNIKNTINQDIYDHVERVRINLSQTFTSLNLPICRRVNQLTLLSNDDTNHCVITPEMISSFVCLSSIRHLIINTSTAKFDLNHFLKLLSIDSLDIAWSQLRPYFVLSNIRSLCLTSECVSWKEIEYLIQCLIPKLEHLQMNVTTSNECRRILNILLSHEHLNNLISIKICICQTLSDEIKQDLEPMFLSSQWIQVKWRMDNWYLYIWK